MTPSHPLFPRAMSRHGGRVTVEQIHRAFESFRREAVLLTIRGNRILWEEKPGFQDRNGSVVALVERASRRFPLPDTTVLVFTGDVLRADEPQEPWVFTFARPATRRNPLFPNFNFDHHRACGIGTWQDCRARLLDMRFSIPFDRRLPVVFFSGAATSRVRRCLAHVTAGDPRFRVHLVDWQDPGCRRYSLEEHCRFRFLLNMNGHGYSGRWHYLLATGSCLLALTNVDPRRRYREFFQEAVLPWVHFVPVWYSDYEPPAFIARRVVRSISMIDPAAIAAAGVRFVEKTLNDASVDRYIREVLCRHAACVVGE